MAAVLIPLASKVEETLEVAATIEGSESAKVEQLLAGEFLRRICSIRSPRDKRRTPSANRRWREIPRLCQGRAEVKAIRVWNVLVPRRT